MSQSFEVIMMVCFGLSWPASVMKSYTCRTTQGKSLTFEIFVWIGYIAGIAGKIISHNITYVLVFYVINILMVSVDICLYFRNKRLDAAAAAARNS